MSSGALPLVWTGCAPRAVRLRGRGPRVPARARACRPPEPRRATSASRRPGRLPSAHRAGRRRGDRAHAGRASSSLVHHLVPHPNQPLQPRAPTSPGRCSRPTGSRAVFKSRLLEVRRGLGAVRLQRRDLRARRRSRRAGSASCRRRSTSSSSTPAAPSRWRSQGARGVHLPDQLRLHRPQGLGRPARRLGATRSTPDDDVCLVLKCVSLARASTERDPGADRRLPRRPRDGADRASTPTSCPIADDAAPLRRAPTRT